MKRFLIISILALVAVSVPWAFQEAGHAPNRIYTSQGGDFFLNGAAFNNDANADISASLEVLDSVSAAELGFLDGALAGTQVASKAVVNDANVNQGVAKVATFHLGTSGSETQITATGDEINEGLDDVPTDISFAFAQGASDITEITITVLDAANAAIDTAFTLTVWLSDASTGIGLTGTSASGTVQAKSASGADFAALTAKKALVVQTLGTGIYILEITDTAKTAFFIAATISSTGKTAVSAQLASGDYGA